MTPTGQPLLILGMHRSGTSYLAALLQSMGVYIGDELVGPQKGNPRGHFEAVPLLRFHEALLAEAQGSEAPTFDKGIFVPRPIRARYTREHRDMARSIVAGLQKNGHWGWKEPRTCLFLDLWREVLPEARAVIVYRHPLEVHQSLLRRGHWGLSLDPGLAMETYAVFNEALLEWKGPDTYLFNAGAGYADLDGLRLDLMHRFGLSDVAGGAPFIEEEFHRLPVSRPLHALTRLLCPKAADVFDRLQERADKPYAWVERDDDPVVEGLLSLLEPRLKGISPANRARLIPLMDILLSGEDGPSGQYGLMAAAICGEHEALGEQHKALGVRFAEQQEFLKRQSEAQAREWAEYESLNKRYESLGTEFARQQKLLQDFKALGTAFKDQQTFLENQSEKYGKIWDDHLRLKGAHDWLAEQFRAQQTAFAEQTNELRRLQDAHHQLGTAFVQQQAQYEQQCQKEKASWAEHVALGKAFAEQQSFLRQQTLNQEAIWKELKTLQGEHQRLGKAFSSQQSFLNKQTQTLGSVWNDYTALQEKHQHLGREFKKQQENMLRLWNNCQTLWEENQRLKQTNPAAPTGEGGHGGKE